MCQQRHTHSRTRTHYSEDSPGNLISSVTLVLIAEIHNSDQRLKSWRVLSFLIETLTCLHHVALPPSHIHLLEEEDVTLLAFYRVFPPH